MALTLITAPAEEPVSLSEAKLYLRVDGSGEDALITGLVKAARGYAESFTCRQFVTATWDLTMDAFPRGRAITLPLPPLQSVTSIKYFDADDVEATLPASDYIVDTASVPGRIVLRSSKSWPSTTLRSANGVIVRFVAGYGNAGAVDEEIKAHIKAMLSYLYEHRGDEDKVFPAAYQHLLWPHRVVSFA